VVVVDGLVLLLFALAGNRLLDFLHVSLAAFRIAGGVLLLLLAIDLVFAHPTGLSSITASEEHEAQRPGDIAVFPLTIPLIAGPGSMTAIVLLMGQAGRSSRRLQSWPCWRRALERPIWRSSSWIRSDACSG
jgi:multiple antibiotic resistance protein